MTCYNLNLNYFFLLFSETANSYEQVSKLFRSLLISIRLLRAVIIFGKATESRPVLLKKKLGEKLLLKKVINLELDLK